MCLVMTCMSYLAAEDYIEIMLCQHDALEHVAYALRHYLKNAELVTRACLALLNLTVCESHVEELVEKDAAALVKGTQPGCRTRRSLSLHRVAGHEMKHWNTNVLPRTPHFR